MTDSVHLGNAFGFTTGAAIGDIVKPDELVLVDLRHPKLQFSLSLLNEQIRKTACLLEAALRECKKSEAIRGASVAVVLRNTAEYVVTFLAISGISCVNALLNPKFKVEDFVFAMEDMKCDMILTEEEGNSEAEAAAKRLNIPCYRFVWDYTTGTPTSTIRRQTNNSVVSSNFAMDTVDQIMKPKGSDICLKLHTSGTTSRPKVVPISHQNCCTTLGNIAQTYKFEAVKDRGLLVMPLFHVHGLFCGCLSPLSRGSRVVLSQGYGFHKSTFWEDILSNKITWVTAVPSMWQILLSAKNAIPSQVGFRFIRGCSSALPPPVAEELEALLKTEVLEAYAMTEATHQMCSNPQGGRKFGSVGLPTGIDCAIIDPESGRIVKQGEAGEICVRGYNVIKGYENLSDEQQRQHFWYPEQLKDVSTSYISRSLTQDLTKQDYNDIMAQYYDVSISFPNIMDINQSPVKDRPFLRTGDIGYMDKEHYVYLIGRSKELINRGGEKIAPVEIDAEFLKHEEIAEVCTFGAPDQILGEVVNMAVVLTPGVQASKELFARIRETSKARIAPFKIPIKIYVCGSLPKGPTGKILRREMPAQVEGRVDYY